MITRYKPVLKTLPALVLALGAAQTHAAGFQLLEQNASGVGNAYAGSAALADNASTIYFNPAGMTQLPGLNVSAGLSLIRPSFKFSNDGSSFRGGPALGNGNGGDAGGLAAVPNAYVSWQVNPNWFVGLGIGAPFGLETKYDDDWIGRYHSQKFAIETININPSVAYKVNDRFSVGVGLNWQHIKADYRRSSPMPLPPPYPAGAFGPDLKARVKMDGNAWGWNIGLLYQVTSDTRLGLSYRSRIKHKASGDTTVSNAMLSMASSGKADVTLPDTAILSLVHDLNPRWTLLADVSWTGWSSIPRLDIRNGGSIPNDSLKLEFRDTWRVALGAHYHLNEKWTIKGGLAYDQSPVDDAALRPTSLPDNNRTWVSLGAQYRFSGSTTLDIGYTRLFTRKTHIDNDSDLTKGTIRGSYKSNVDLLGIQISHRF